jgi:hypothetical protein
MSDYNPKNIQQYFGKTFVTKSGSKYGISRDGRFTGRPSIEGAEILLIAGVSENNYWNIRQFLDYSFPESKKKLDDLILEKGLEPIPGLHLVVSLKPNAVKETERFGLISSIIEDIV